MDGVANVPASGLTFYMTSPHSKKVNSISSAFTKAKIPYRYSFQDSKVQASPGPLRGFPFCVRVVGGWVFHFEFTGKSGSNSVRSQEHPYLLKIGAIN
jgi:hypothetical protein